ncbi:MAG: calcium/sodium antiporter [Candidatus Methanomethylophilaceae archaeon]|jgi:cation:H+ antiporter
MEWVLLGIPVGIVLLYIGSELTVDGAKKFALLMGITPFAAGLTIVAIGSSLPEAITSIVSRDNPEIIIGNIIGSNSANAGIAIGLAAVISPIACKFADIKFEMAAMIAAVFSILILSLNGSLGYIDGIILLAMLVLFIAGVYRFKSKNAAEDAEEEKPSGSKILSIGMAAAGIVLLYFGAKWFIGGAVRLAEISGLSDLIIGLVLVAVGSALPEISICLMAAYRGENELAVSNVVGSIVFNTFFALGIGALFADIPIGKTTLIFHIPVMIFLASAVFFFVYRKNAVGRKAGAVLFSAYAVYLALMFFFPELTSGIL